MLKGRRIELGWTALVLALTLAGLATSRGEPDCTGPFIRGATDSLPPQCGSPIESLPIMAIVWVVGLVAILVAREISRPRKTA